LVKNSSDQPETQNEIKHGIVLSTNDEEMKQSPVAVRELLISLNKTSHIEWIWEVLLHLLISCSEEFQFINLNKHEINKRSGASLAQSLCVIGSVLSSFLSLYKFVV